MGLQLLILFVGSYALKRAHKHDDLKWVPELELSARAAAHLETDASARARWEKRNGVDFPGSQYGGVDLNCSFRSAGHHPLLGMDGDRKYFVMTAVHRFAAGRAFPLRRSLEIGPCDKPVPLEGIVVEKHYVDWAASVAGCSRGRTYIPPTYLDDAQWLATVANSTYDLVIAAHVLEHIPNVLVALQNWLRVLKPDGIAAIMLPDPCTQKVMDSVRLALPASHYLEELSKGASDAYTRHSREVALSGTQFLLSFRNETAASLSTSQKLESISQADLERVRRLSSITNGLGHLHVWSLDTLRDMLHQAEAVLPFRTLFVAPAFAFANKGTEFRIILRRTHQPSKETPRASPTTKPLEVHLTK